MKDKSELESLLLRIDGRGYKAYKELRGSYRMDWFTLHIDHVQGDPFAAPSRLCLEAERSKTALPRGRDASPAARTALSDFIARAFRAAFQEARTRRRRPRGSGKSGLLEIDAGGQEILPRTAVLVKDDLIEVRFFAGLPARGRTVLGREAADMLCRELPEAAKAALQDIPRDRSRLEAHLQAAENFHAIQQQLEPMGLVAFIAEDSVLPRASGVDPRPLRAGQVVKFKSPPGLRVEMSLSGGEKVAGMGIPKGVTLIVGGGFHGKSTLLEALSLGVYPHIPGDGRELAVSHPASVKVRAEDGRYIAGVDISPFIDNLPFGKDTKSFSTENASGSTSQAANIMEALEMGAKVLLIDEDTSASNFMIRDRRMQELVSKDREPITPFIDRVREILEKYNCSTVLVMGGSGDYFEVADTVIRMEEYKPALVTEQARRIAKELPAGRKREVSSPMAGLPNRRPRADSFDPSKGKREVKIGAKGLREIHFGTTALELSALEQMTDPAQTRMIGEMIHFFATCTLPRHRSLREGILAMFREVEEKGLDIISPVRRGDLALPRPFEVAAAINRMRTLKVES